MNDKAELTIAQALANIQASAQVCGRVTAAQNRTFTPKLQHPRFGDGGRLPSGVSGAVAARDQEMLRTAAATGVSPPVSDHRQKRPRRQLAMLRCRGSCSHPRLAEEEQTAGTVIAADPDARVSRCVVRPARAGPLGQFLPDWKTAACGRSEAGPAEGHGTPEVTGMTAGYRV